MISGNTKDSLVEIKKNILHAATISKEGHIPSSLSILDILWVLYDRILRITPNNIGDLHRNHFILSKGHASMALYGVLVEKGFFPKDEMNKFPGVQASTGSLGHGLPIATGLALGLKIKKNNNRVFVLVGDGECNEGTIWESAMLAAQHKLNNLSCIIDYNHSTDRALNIGDLADKFRSFGWESIIINGHNHEEIFGALNNHPANTDKPYAVVANTIKGYGIKSMENNPAWHHRSPTNQELNSLINEIY